SLDLVGRQAVHQKLEQPPAVAQQKKGKHRDQNDDDDDLDRMAQEVREIGGLLLEDGAQTLVARLGVAQNLLQRRILFDNFAVQLVDRLIDLLLECAGRERGDLRAETRHDQHGRDGEDNEERRVYRRDGEVV